MHPLAQIENGKLTKCAAVVVTYCPTLENLQSISKFARQFARVHVVDNASSPADRDRLVAAAKENSNVVLRLLEENVGLATGLNEGVRAVQQAGFEWAALFDQDTVPTEHFASEVSAATSNGDFGKDVALFAPRHVHPVSGEDSAFAPAVAKYKTCSEIQATITSGSFISLAAHGQIGGFADDLFIDYIDYDYSFRLQKAGFRQIQLDQVKLPHQVGERAHRKVLGIPISLNLHSPLRQYYMLRNRLRLISQFGIRYPAWAFRELSWGTVGWLLLILCEKNRGDFVRFGVRGIVDAVRGRFGKYR